MARPKAFDEQDVLTAAMHAFRRQGFHHLSVAALEAATGLGTSSLYNAFGGKAGLFSRALGHYVDSVVAPRLAAYAGPGSGLDELEQLYLTLFEPPLDDGYGCLLVNSAAELGGEDTAAAQEVRAALRVVQRHVEDVVRRELGPGAADEHAARLVLVYHGVLLHGRAGLLTPAHRRAVHREFEELRRLKENRS